MTNEPVYQPRFICDDHLGKLARYLRIGGFDTYFDRVITDNRLLQVSLDEKRWLLTRNRRMVERTLVRDVYLVTADRWPEQLRGVLSYFDLSFRAEQMFTRCLEDNTVTEPVAKETIIARVFPFTYDHHDNYRLCPTCGRVYWSGTHIEAIERRLERYDIPVIK